MLVNSRPILIIISSNHNNSILLKQYRLTILGTYNCLQSLSELKYADHILAIPFFKLEKKITLWKLEYDKNV